MVVEIIKQFAMVVRVGSSTCGCSRLFILFYIFSILPLIYLPNLKLKKKKEIYVLESVLLDNIRQCVCHAIFLFIIVILSLLINDKFYQNFFNDGVDMLTSKFRHRSIMQPLFKVISTSYITNFKNRFCLLS
jgi:hypothetical protein